LWWLFLLLSVFRAGALELTFNNSQVLMFLLVSLLLFARELAKPTFIPNALCVGFEDTVGVLKTRATGAAH
jgi:hypothetical protein